MSDVEKIMGMVDALTEQSLLRIGYHSREVDDARKAIISALTALVEERDRSVKDGQKAADAYQDVGAEMFKASEEADALRVRVKELEGAVMSTCWEEDRCVQCGKDEPEHAPDCIVRSIGAKA